MTIRQGIPAPPPNNQQTHEVADMFNDRYEIKNCVARSVAPVQWRPRKSRCFRIVTATSCFKSKLFSHDAVDATIHCN